MLNNVQILFPPTLSSYQFFLQDFSNACVEVGIGVKQGIGLPWKVRLVAAKLRLSRRVGCPSSDSRRLLVPCGGYPDSFAFPYGYAHEIVPVLWDTWPRYHCRLLASFRRHRIRLAFFTQRQVAEWVQGQLGGVRCVWLPEAVKTAGYKRGKNLVERSINVLELGRLMHPFHDAIVGKIDRHLYRDPGRGLLFPDFEALTNGLADAKITVCYPRCDTHPHEAGAVETLTQRYWECMLSRTVMVGRAPKELVDFCGYNPVVEVPPARAAEMVEELLSDIGRQQRLVDRNEAFAREHADWSSRMEIILETLRC